MACLHFFDIANHYKDPDASNDPLAKIDNVVP